MRAIHCPTLYRRLAAVLLATLAAGCGEVWNDPYPAAERGRNILYSAFTQRPKHLDPVQSYSEDEATFLYQIYEPPLQYHYLKRPFQLNTAAAAQMPVLRQFDAAGKLLPPDADPAQIARSEYEITIRPGIRFQPHPAFAVDAKGQPLYLALTDKDLADKRALGDFPATGTRELTADDFVYQIKRLAHPRLHSPVLELMGDYIVGLKDLHTKLAADEKQRNADGKGGAWIENLMALNQTVCKGKPIDSREFPSSPEATQALLSGGVDAQMEDSAVLQDAVGKLRGKMKISSTENHYPVVVGLGVRKGNEELAATIRKAMATLEKNGTYDALLKKYNVSKPTEAEFKAALAK